MTTNKRYLTAFVCSLSAGALLSGVAAAGNSKGTPPGQAKHQSHVSASASVKGHAKAKTSGSVSASASLGVKPSASTNTAHNTNAAAASTQTKLYGNGKTAGQIAMQNGASASTNLYGPGNSQPHKASLCTNGKAHLVDVHALKAHASASSCTSASTSTSTSTSANAAANGSANVAANGTVGVGAKANGGGKGTKGAMTPPSTTRNSGRAGSNGSVAGQAKAARPVTGAAHFTG